jgi:hypothetical protein
MSKKIKLIVAGTLLTLTAMALGLTMSVVLNANANTGNQSAKSAAPVADAKSGSVANDIQADVPPAADEPQGGFMGMGGPMMGGNMDDMMQQASQLADRFGFGDQFGKLVGQLRGPEGQGNITKIENGGAKLTVNKGQIINIDGSTVLGDSNGSITKESLQVGDRVVAVGKKETDGSLTAKYVVKLPALPKPLTGDLTSVDTGANSLKFKSNNVDWTATLNSDGKVYKDGKEAKLSDLKTGDKVTVIGIADETAKTVKASQIVQGRPQLGNFAAGKVKSVDTAGNSFVLTQNDPATKNSTDVKVTVDSNTKFIGNNIKALGDLKADAGVVVRGEKQADGSIKATEVASGGKFPGNFGFPGGGQRGPGGQGKKP